ncbi:Maf family protein [Granulosicoccus antarcticus]|uniref:dTTP/UTP pyrophosphatase n=1 Tax=Granulosicoccus antarcticus IMCC3135 TaxID=1192854 RepID=A0A2Z2NXF5_9GAMM|nr:Maf family protein [Granulosicoccus antarcticus]ASJ76126.1 Maf-like protein YhdE [Granulosicoccus antarcticus IMCC3135]
MIAFHDTQFILASASPRRQQLLRQLGFDPVCMPVDIDEQAFEGETPAALVTRLACQKAERCLQLGFQKDKPASGNGVVVLGADTVIDLDGEILGKPQCKSDGLSMLQRLADREHSVLTGVCVLRADFKSVGSAPEKNQICIATQLRFGPVSKAQANAYWQSGEPVDKAGGYAIQGLGAQFVAYLSGSYSNVVGLPLYETNHLLTQAGLSANYPA